MNIVWYAVLRPLYSLGLLVAAPLFLIVLLSGAGREPEVSIPVLLGCMAYFALGYFVFVSAPRRLEARLMARVRAHETRGFVPVHQATSVLHNRYFGLDPQHRKALYVDVNTGTEKLLDFDCLDSWEISLERNKPALVQLVTNMPALPRIALRIGRQECERFRTGLAATIG